MRKIILTILGFLLIAGAVFLAKKLAALKQEPKPVEQKVVTTVFTQTVKNTNTPITLSTSGSLAAKRKVEIFSEVQGIFESSSQVFKPGSNYVKGQTLLQINADEHRANLKAQKSSLYNQIVILLPDLKLDYPLSFPNWEKYVQGFDVEKTLPAMPEPIGEKEKLFIAGRNITTTYYNIKNLEERLTKYAIHAPFSGVITEALVNPGTLIRIGQKLGEFIDPSVYEIEIKVNASYANLLQLGKSVGLNDLERTNSWIGKVARVNGKVDQASQTIAVFIEVAGKDLKEGMYLEADLEAKRVENTFEVDRQLLHDGNHLFVVNDTLLDIMSIEPIFFKENTVIVKGLADGTQILAKPVPGSYKGMRVKVIEN